MPPASRAAASQKSLDTGKKETLEDIRADIGDCTRCKLHTTRTKIVFADGSPKARVVFVGEGPGRDEDLKGLPFVGRAGVLLTDIIEKGMGLKRSEVYICNVVKCRPTVDLAFEKDRAPEPDEVAACGGFLLRQLRSVHPEVIVTLGNPSTQFLLQTKDGITRLRGKWQEWEGISVMPTFHPAYVLRNPPSKKEVWADIQLVMERLGLKRPAKGAR
ncbi:MAG: uracil-DNA glycosylase [Bdellovibrionota bacterium]